MVPGKSGASGEALMACGAVVRVRAGVLGTCCPPCFTGPEEPEMALPYPEQGDPCEILI